MFLGQINATDNVRSARIEINKPISALLLLRYSNFSMVHGLAAVPERLTVEIESKTGRQISLMNRIEVGVIAHYSQYGEGLITETHTPAGSEYHASQVWNTRALLSLTTGKSVLLNVGETMTATLDGLIPGSAYRVFGIEFPEQGTNLLEFSTLTMASGVRSKSFDVDAMEALVLRQGAYLQKVSVTFKNGYVANYTLEELVALNADNNDIEGIVRSASLGPLNLTVVTSAASDFVTLIVRDAVSVEVLTDGSERVFWQVSLASRLLN